MPFWKPTFEILLSSFTKIFWHFCYFILKFILVMFFLFNSIRVNLIEINIWWMNIRLNNMILKELNRFWIAIIIKNYAIKKSKKMNSLVQGFSTFWYWRTPKSKAVPKLYPRNKIFEFLLLFDYVYDKFEVHNSYPFLVDFTWLRMDKCFHTHW